MLPHHKRQPSLDDISHLVHSRSDKSALFVVLRRYLLCLGKAKAGQADSESGHDIACPFPTFWDVPDGEQGACDDIEDSSEDHGWPSGSSEESVRTLSVRQSGHNDDCLRDRRVDVDLRD